MSKEESKTATSWKTQDARTPVNMTPAGEERGRNPVIATPVPGSLEKGRAPVNMTPVQSQGQQQPQGPPVDADSGKK